MQKLCIRLHIVVKSSIISSIKEGAKNEELHETYRKKELKKL